MAQHKWHKEIKAWADGAIIQFKTIDGWEDCYENNPSWTLDNEIKFRIKPQPKEPQHLYAHRTNEGDITFEIDEGVSVVGYQYIGKIKLEE